MSNTETRLIYEANPNSPNELERLLMPSGALTDILRVSHSWRKGDDVLPKPGDRLDEFGSPNGSGRSTHWSPGDWIVDRVVYYPRPNDDEPAIAICYCEYSPIEKDWKPMNVGRPVPELLAEMDAVMAE